MVFDSRWAKYSEMVRIDSVKEAKISADRLLKEYNRSKQSKKKGRIIEITIKAGKHSLARSKDKSLSEADRKQAKNVAYVYANAYDVMRANR